MVEMCKKFFIALIKCIFDKYPYIHLSLYRTFLYTYGVVLLLWECFNALHFSVCVILNIIFAFCWWWFVCAKVKCCFIRDEITKEHGVSIKIIKEDTWNVDSFN
jgi:hypothetical protein